MKRRCSCGQGYRSRYDGKCGHCRSGREQKRHVWRLQHDLEYQYPPEY